MFLSNTSGRHEDTWFRQGRTGTFPRFDKRLDQFLAILKRFVVRPSMRMDQIAPFWETHDIDRILI